MYASPMDFVLPYIGGIENVGVGFDEVRFAPYLYSEDCAAHYAMKTRFGKISIDWQYKDGVFKADIRKPAGIKATLSVLGHTIALEETKTEITLTNK